MQVEVGLPIAGRGAQEQVLPVDLVAGGTDRRASRRPVRAGQLVQAGSRGDDYFGAKRMRLKDQALLLVLANALCSRGGNLQARPLKMAQKGFARDFEVALENGSFFLMDGFWAAGFYSGSVYND